MKKKKILRNWLTYKMRETIMQYERTAFHSSANFNVFKAKFNQAMAYEIKCLMIRYKNENKLDIFDKLIAHKGILCKKIREGEYRFQIILR